jgi:hypothetical protein
MADFKTTVELLESEELGELGDGLARAKCIESRQVYESGEPSEVYRRYEALVGRLTAAQAGSLLRHRSPVIRGYLAGHVVREHPAELRGVYPLLSDPTPVTTQIGCIRATSTLVDEVLEDLWHGAEREDVQDLLLRAAQDPALGPRRGKALEPVAKQRPDEAITIARALLDGSDPELLGYAVGVLGIAGDHEMEDRVAALGRHPDPEKLAG